MDARLNFYDNAVAAKFAKYINSAGAVITNSTLPAVTQELVKIRASQINSCSGCTDMHTKDAAHAGESATRLNLIAAWREANVLPKLSEPRWSSPSKALALPMLREASRTTPGRTQPSTTTMISSERW